MPTSIVAPFAILVWMQANPSSIKKTFSIGAPVSRRTSRNDKETGARPEKYRSMSGGASAAIKRLLKVDFARTRGSHEIEQKRISLSHRLLGDRSRRIRHRRWPPSLNAKALLPSWLLAVEAPAATSARLRVSDVHPAFTRINRGCFIPIARLRGGDISGTMGQTSTFSPFG